jgi:hypothetical protein
MAFSVAIVPWNIDFTLPFNERENSSITVEGEIPVGWVQFPQ